MKFERYRFGNVSKIEFEEGGNLYGWESYYNPDDPQYVEAEAAFLRYANKHLYSSPCTELLDGEVVGVLPDGRYALLSDAITGTPFWIEVKED